MQEMSDFDKWLEQNSILKKLGGMRIQILKQAVKQSDKGLTAQQVADSLGLCYRTPHAYLKQLEEKGLLLTPTGGGRYYAPANLRERLLATESFYSDYSKSDRSQ